MKTLITAHSGCEGTERDSLESIDKALRLHADIIEVDVRMDDKGTLRISHNKVTQEEYEQKPTLEEVFAKIKDTHLGINCDIKDDYVIDKTLDLAEKYGFKPGRLILTGSVGPLNLSSNPEINDRADVYMNIENAFRLLYASELIRKDKISDIPLLLKSPQQVFAKDMTGILPLVTNLVKLYKTLGVKGINLPFQVMSDEMAVYFKEHDLAFSVWTVNEAEMADRLLALGAFNITTTEPKMVMERRGMFHD